jgi:hypothetical protein
VVDGASPTRNGFYDLDLFTGTGVLDKVPEVDDATGAGVGSPILVILILSGWVRGLRCRLTLAAHGATPPE